MFSSMVRFTEEKEAAEEYFPGDTSRGAGMERNLQREKDLKATRPSILASFATRKTGAKGKAPVRGKRLLSTDLDNDDIEDDEEYEPLSKPSGRAAKKLKYTELDSDEQDRRHSAKAASHRATQAKLCLVTTLTPSRRLRESRDDRRFPSHRSHRLGPPA